MPDILDALRAARRSRGLTQREVAEQIGTTQSAIARLEAHRTDPKLGTLAAYAAEVGRRVDVVAGDLTGSCAGTIRSSLSGGDADAALRAVIQLFDDLCYAVDPWTELRLEPPTTGTAEWDAAIAAACERAARLTGTAVPGWTAAPSRFLDRLWAPVEDILGRTAPGLIVMLLAWSPPEFAVRGVLIDAESLTST